MEEFFLRAAARGGGRFVLGGGGWDDKPMPANVARVGHVYTRDHNAFNASTRAVLNISRESMARYGLSPATRVFEAAGAAACIITDAWEGIELFPGAGLRSAGGARRARRWPACGAPDARPRAQSGAAARAASWRSIPTRTARSRWSGCSTAGRARRAPRACRYEDRLPGALHHLLVGQRPCHHLSRAGTRSWRRRGHDVLFLERDVPWYAENRDLPQPPFGRTELYGSLDELKDRFAAGCARSRPGGGGLLRARRRGGGGLGDSHHPRRAGVLRHRYARDAGQAGARRNGISYARADPALPALSLFHRRADTGAHRAPLRLARARACCIARPTRTRTTPSPGRADGTSAISGPTAKTARGMLDCLLLEPARRWQEGAFHRGRAAYPHEIRWPANVERVEHLPPAATAASTTRSASP